MVPDPLAGKVRTEVHLPEASDLQGFQGFALQLPVAQPLLLGSYPIMRVYSFPVTFLAFLLVRAWGLDPKYIPDFLNFCIKVVKEGVKE